MRFNQIVDITLGFLRLPLRAISAPADGDCSVDPADGRMRFVPTSGTVREVLDDSLLGVAGGVAPLGPDGKVPAANLPATTGGGASDLVGEVRMWAGSPAALPSNYLGCDGSEIAVSLYPALFAALGYLHGRPSVPTAFRLPNLVNRVPVGGVGINQMTAGSIHRVVVRNGGTGFIDGVYTGVPFQLVGAGSLTGSPTARVTVTGGAIVSVEVEGNGGSASGISFTSTASGLGTSNCNIILSPGGGLSPGVGGFAYDLLLSPAALAAPSWGVRMTDRGAGYASLPTVTIGGAVGAEARAVIDGGRVLGVIVTNPGIGTPTTVTFSGGGFSTPATASIVSWPQRTVVADQGGEQQHVQLGPEVGAHKHVTTRGNGGGSLGAYFSYSSSGANFNTNTDGMEDNTPAGVAASWLPPYYGILYIVRAS